MADFAFDRAVEFVLSHEGGFTDDSSDPGGPTNWGISLRFLSFLDKIDESGYAPGDLDKDGDIDLEDIRGMKVEVAIRIYREQWWERYKYGNIKSIQVASKVMDLSVNMGPHQAHLCVQRALRACGSRVVDDGVFGPITTAAVNSVDPRSFMAAVRSEAAGFYRGLNKELYLRGWLNRAYD